MKLLIDLIVSMTMLLSVSALAIWSYNAEGVGGVVLAMTLLLAVSVIIKFLYVEGTR
jgi:hypothetical protein